MIVLYDDIKKADPALTALAKLRSFLDEKEPQLVQFLYRTWGNMRKAITYKEIREAILRGDLTAEQLFAWRQDYVKLVVRYVEPMWIEAMERANEPIRRYNTVWQFDADRPSVNAWCENEAAQFVTSVTDDQIKAVRFAVRRAATLNSLTVDTLSRVIRPMVGLDYRQTVANMRFYEQMIADGMSPSKAEARSIVYSARQSRYRAYRIARTELAMAYGQGAYEGTKQAQEAGLLGHTVKVWCTAADERVCDICGSLEGARIEMEEDFYYRDKRTGQDTRINPKLRHKSIGKTNPAHPHCRCSVLYEEVTPPIYDMR